jgi:type I restriction enzyme, S subunit
MSGTFQETEIGPIPQNWRLATGEEITSLITKGASPRWQGFAYGNSGMLFVTSENVRDGFLDISKPKFLPMEFHEKIARSAIRKGDMLVNLVGASIGRSCLIRRELGVANINQAVAVFRPNTLVDPDFVSFAFQHPETIQRILGMQVEAARPNISLGDLRAFKLALPPLPEQQAIAAALSDADGVVAGLERVIAKKRLIKQGAMQDLLTARRRLPGFSGEWEVKPFAQIARIRNTKVQTLGNPLAQNCIELEQVEHETGRILFWVDATNRATVKYQFEPGDVLFGRLRPYLRKFHRANIQGVCSTEIWPLMTQGINSGFLYQVVQSDGFIAAACEAYGTHMPRADWGKIATHQIQVPVDPNEQEAIGEVLADMENEIQTLESRLAKARAVKEGMMQNLLTGRVRLV